MSFAILIMTLTKFEHCCPEIIGSSFVHLLLHSNHWSAVAAQAHVGQDVVSGLRLRLFRSRRDAYVNREHNTRKRTSELLCLKTYLSSSLLSHLSSPFVSLCSSSSCYGCPSSSVLSPLFTIMIIISMQSPD